MKISFPAAAALYMLLLTGGNLLFFATEMRQEREQVHREAEATLDAVTERLLFDLAEIYSDLRHLSDRPVELGARQLWEAEYLSLMRHKKRYDQIRFLDREGRERIRINYNGGTPEVIGEALLQNKQERYYVRDALALKPGEVYISPMDLNIEHRQVEVPLKPMLRFVAPAVGRDGSPTGLVVLNYLAEGMLSRLRRLVEEFPGRLLLLNEEGYYFIGFDREDEWGFMFPGKTGRTFAERYPAVWEAMQHQESGHLKNAAGIFDFALLNPARDIVRDGSTLKCQECGWRVVTITPAALLWQDVEARFWKLLPLNLLLLLAGLLTLKAVFVSIERRRHQEAKIDQLNRAIASERELFIEGPTVIMEFKNAYGWPVTYASENVATLFGFEKARFEGGELDLAGVIAPEYLERFAEAMARSLREQRLHFQHEPFEIVGAGGTRIWVQGMVSLVSDALGRVTHFLGYFNDISALKHAERELLKAGNFVQTVVDAIADPTLVIDVESYEVVLANKAAQQLYIGDGELRPMACYQMSHARGTPCDGKDDPCPIIEILETREASRVVHKHFGKGGTPIYVELVATPIFDEAGNVVQIIESHRDITHHIELEAELKQLASTDRLTGAFNRARFDDELREQVESALRYGIAMGVIMFDIDHFKRVNDSFGHDVGDQVLIEITELVRNRIRRQDVLARWGGEEFTILIPKTHHSALLTMMENLRRTVEEHLFGSVGHVTSSFGATMICRGDTAESLMKRVDRALYRSKEGGRNRCTVLECEAAQSSE